jgi:protein-tyrosine phosphatase
MQVEVHPVEGPWPGQLAVAPRPRGGDWLYTEVLGWSGLRIGTVVSLLEPHEAAELDIQDEAETCGANGLDFLSFPIEDRSTPASYVETLGLISDLDSRLSRGENVLIHCRQGIGRTGIIAAGLLFYRGFDPQTAIQRVSQARGIPVPETKEQLAWLRNLGSSMIAARLAG